VVPACSPVNVNPSCHPELGAVELVLMAYSTVCPLPGAGTAFTVILFSVFEASAGAAAIAAPGDLLSLGSPLSPHAVNVAISMISIMNNGINKNFFLCIWNSF